MWTYSISTGSFSDGQNTFKGYSGRDECKNNASDDAIVNRGPVPIGIWYIGTALDDAKLGPCIMRLTADAKTIAFGRSGFYIHGDSISHPGDASDGCIILDHTAREIISKSLDKELQVIA